ncbi:MAG: hypothetical protein BWY09_01081 [Candidatus Hydrogenedentes bacterium ADurb.Bin179]|nr:MAG: hypothetical protein BWY09_01081 [Candidatus Hydrogenedentes bacterium ADurb.Bin179]
MAVIPVNIDGRHGTPRRERIFDGGGDGEGLLVAPFLFHHFHRVVRRFHQFQRHIGRVHDVTGHVAEGAAAEILPCAPVMGRNLVIVRTPLCRTNPPVPIQIFRGHFRGKRFGQALVVPDRPMRPHMHLPNVSDGAAPDHLAQGAHTVAAVPLIAHLCHYAGFGGDVFQQARFGHRVGQRLLDIDMFAHHHGHIRRRSVGVIGRGNGHRVYFGHFFQHDTVIFELFGVFHPVERLGAAVPVHITQGHHVFPQFFAAHNIGKTLAAGADGGDIHFVVWGKFSWNHLGRIGGNRGRIDNFLAVLRPYGAKSHACCCGRNKGPSCQRQVVHGGIPLFQKLYTQFGRDINHTTRFGAWSKYSTDVKPIVPRFSRLRRLCYTGTVPPQGESKARSARGVFTSSKENQHLIMTIMESIVGRVEWKLVVCRCCFKNDQKYRHKRIMCIRQNETRLYPISVISPGCQCRTIDI